VIASYPVTSMFFFFPHFLTPQVLRYKNWTVQTFNAMHNVGANIKKSIIATTWHDNRNRCILFSFRVTHGRKKFWKHAVAVNLTAFYAWRIQCKQLTSYKTAQLPLRSTSCSGLRRGVALATVLLSFPTTYGLQGAVSWHRRTRGHVPKICYCELASCSSESGVQQ